jgi:hypothetical protein
MTTLTAPDTTDTTAVAVPRRRTLVGLAVGFVALFAIGFATSQDPGDYDSPATVLKDYDMSRPALTVLMAGGIFTGAVLVFFGAALKAALERRTRSWITSVVGYGFTFGGVTMLIFTLASVWLYHAVDIGDPSAVQAITIIDVGAFPALMMLFVTAYISVGLAAYAGRSLPTWLCAVSVVLGVISPISVGGYASFTLFPVWVIAIAALVKLDPK